MRPSIAIPRGTKPDRYDGPLGSGVHRTSVSFDGVTFERVDRPVAVPEDALLVMACSEDVAGNREYPGWVAGALGTSRSALIFEPDGLEPQDVDVLNLDPLHVSEPIFWRATAEAPWVRLEPSEGRTPRSLRVWIDPERLPGDNREITAEVLIHDLSEQRVVSLLPCRSRWRLRPRRTMRWKRCPGRGKKPRGTLTSAGDAREPADRADTDGSRPTSVTRRSKLAPPCSARPGDFGLHDRHVTWTVGG